MITSQPAVRDAENFASKHPNKMAYYALRGDSRKDPYACIVRIRRI